MVILAKGLLDPEADKPSNLSALIQISDSCENLIAEGERGGNGRAVAGGRGSLLSISTQHPAGRMGKRERAQHANHALVIFMDQIGKQCK